jgi:hypothetical protein
MFFPLAAGAYRIGFVFRVGNMNRAMPKHLAGFGGAQPGPKTFPSMAYKPGYREDKGVQNEQAREQLHDAGHTSFLA